MAGLTTGCRVQTYTSTGPHLDVKDQELRKNGAGILMAKGGTVKNDQDPRERFLTTRESFSSLLSIAVKMIHHDDGSENHSLLPLK
jgi:hypothetical protein